MLTGARQHLFCSRNSSAPIPKLSYRLLSRAQISKKRGSSTGIPAGQVRFRFSLSGTWLTICNIIIKYNSARYFYSQNAN
ncbi:hypothetical protein EVY29_27005, partial [Klebsiella pneumoniae]